MLRPIDTQTIYQQTPEMAGRQHVQNHTVEMQQDQFATLLQKETVEKQQFVQKTEKEEKVDHDLNKNKKKESQERGKKRKKAQDSQNDKKHKEDKSAGHFDIRI